MPPKIEKDTARKVLQNAMEDLKRRQKSKEVAEELKASFRKFIPAAWPTVEPSRPLIPCWPIDCMADHLQGVAEGRIQNLLLLFSPGTSKSLITSVLFLAWMWTKNPEWRATFASYDVGLSTRDSVRCRDLMKSVWYQETFCPTWTFSETQDEKTYFVNNLKGFRVSTSVAGKGTGWRSHGLFCFHAGTMVTTDHGQIPIERIVGERLRVKILAYDHANERVVWRRIERFESFQGRESVRVKFSNGKSIQCTSDHPFFVSGKGYIQAGRLPANAEVISQDELRVLWRRDHAQAESHREGQARLLLRERLHGQVATEDSPREKPVSMRHLRYTGLSPAKARPEGEERFLQRRVREQPQRRKAQSSLRWRGVGQNLRVMRSGILRDSVTRHERPVLQREVSWTGQSGGEQCQMGCVADGAVPRMREGVSNSDSKADWTANLLLSQMRQPSTSQGHEGGEQPKLHSRPESRGISARVQDHSTTDSQAGRAQMQDVRGTFGIRRPCPPCSPHRLRQVQQRSVQPSIAVQELPCGSTRDHGKASRGQRVTVLSVESVPAPDRVFNLRVAENHNYFAEGILVHNCDDPLNITDQYSEAALETCRRWFFEVYYNRLIDMATGSRVVIMQRISDRDLASHIIAAGGFEVVCVPMEYDPARSRVSSIGWSDPRTKRGELMAPQVFSAEVVEDTKQKLGESAFAAQYNQEPAPSGGGILKAHKWCYWQPPNMDLPPVTVRMPDGTVRMKTALPLPERFDLCLQTWDLSFKDTASSDYVVGQVHAVSGANRYVLKQKRDRMDLPKTIAAIREMTGDNPLAHLKLVEGKANGPAVIQMLRDEIPGFVDVEPEGGKVARAAAASVELDSENWFLPHPMIAPWVGNPENPLESGFLAEATMFPGAKNDDQVDAWSQGAIRIQKERIGGVFGVSESEIKIQPFDLKQCEKWPRIFGLWIDYRETAAVWLFRQPETGQHFLYAEYHTEVGDPGIHVTEIRKLGDVQGYLVPDAGGREARDGYALARKYGQLGARVETIPEREDTQLADFTEAIRSGKVKVFASLSRFFDQYRMFRRDDKGKLPSYNRGVIMAAMVAWRARDRIRSPRPQTPSATEQFGKPTSWMAG